MRTLTTYWMLGLFALAAGLPTSLFGRSPKEPTTAARVVITAPPAPAAAEPRVARKPNAKEVVISETSQRPVYEFVPNFASLGSRIPMVVKYYKGDARLLGPRKPWSTW